MQKHCLYVQVQIFLTWVTGFMQKEEPFIHTLYNQLKDLLLTILGRFCKQSLKADSHKLPNTNVGISSLNWKIILEIPSIQQSF